MTLLLSLDLLIVWFSIYTAYYFRFTGSMPEFYLTQMSIMCIISAIIFAMANTYFKLYNRIWEYASVGEIVSIFRAVTTGALLSYAVTWLITGRQVPLSAMLRIYETTLLLIGGSRFLWRVLRDGYMLRRTRYSNALIVGAGSCGTMIAREMKQNRSLKLYPVAFIDDDVFKQRSRVLGLPIIGGREAIPEAVKRYEVEHIIIAMPSASRKETARIIEICKQTGAKLKIIPEIRNLIEGKTALNKIRDVNIEDLLGRDPVKVDLQGIADYVSGKTVLVTGAGGSIGSELCRQIAAFEPGHLLLLGHGENSIYMIEMELREKFPNLHIQPVIADIQDRPRIESVFQTYRPQVVFHAAAHKHVPLMEANPAEAVKNNIFGTRNVAECAHEYRAETFVLISTDKAVNPTSIMGATKRVAEMIVQSLGAISETKFAAVRFGNVLGSRGSVIPLFQSQIERGGPVTVTHPDMVRYFMTIPEAVQLVIQAGALAEGGEIFVLDMGEPVRISKLAEDLIRLSGYEPHEDIKIEYTGIRPGEKLFEELLIRDDQHISTRHDRIFIEKPLPIDRRMLLASLKRMETLVSENGSGLKAALFALVPTYQGVVENERIHAIVN
jgi:FlaA1/EpsC-like NDP-sugar epimerase